MFKLVISDDEGKTTVVPLVRDEITIGRKEGNTIRLTERNVSRRHAKLLKANGAFRIEDLQSYNGVKVNGRKIDGHVNLKAGDQIGIGDYLLALQLDAADSAKTTAAVQAPGTPEAATAMIAAPEQVPPARLVMLSPPAPGAEFALSKPKLRVGRAEDLDAWVNHRSISREHAEVVREGDRYKVVDLGSANGVRVNGQEVSAAPLNPGDVLELGQVKFRFVGEGETYVFDADRTIQMEAIEAGEGMPKAPILAALGIVGAAIIVAAIFALSGGDDDDTAPVGITQIDRGAGSAEGEAASPEVGGAADPDEALRNCQTALAAEEWSRALGQGELALRADPSDEARRCRDQAQVGQHFERGMQQYDDEEYEAAYNELSQIPEDSPFRDRQRFGRAMAEYHLMQADRLADQDPTAALEHAQAALDTNGARRSQRSQARRLVQDLTRLASAAPPSSSMRRRSTGDRPTRPSRPERPVEAPMDTPMMAQAREACDVGSPDYTRCIIRTLEGRARSARELNQLIAAYRQIGNQGAAFRHMQTFVRRFPNHARSQGYRQILAAHGIEVGT